MVAAEIVGMVIPLKEVIMSGQGRGRRRRKSEGKSGETLLLLLLLRLKMRMRIIRSSSGRSLNSTIYFINPALPSALLSMMADCLASLKSSFASSTTAMEMVAWR